MPDFDALKVDTAGFAPPNIEVGRETALRLRSDRLKRRFIALLGLACLALFVLFSVA